MSMKRLLKSGLILGAVLVGASAHAATVSQIQGRVLVNAKPVIGAQSLKIGETVVVEKGAAQLVYADGCTIQVGSGSSMTIAETSPCALQAANSQIKTGQIPASTAGLGGLSTTGLVVGGAAVIGGVAVTASQRSNSNRQASP